MSNFIFNIQMYFSPIGFLHGRIEFYLVIVTFKHCKIGFVYLYNILFSLKEIYIILVINGYVI
jgi:hypothetical protein